MDNLYVAEYIETFQEAAVRGLERLDFNKYIVILETEFASLPADSDFKNNGQKILNKIVNGSYDRPPRGGERHLIIPHIQELLDLVNNQP